MQNTSKNSKSGKKIESRLSSKSKKSPSKLHKNTSSSRITSQKTLKKESVKNAEKMNEVI